MAKRQLTTLILAAGEGVRMRSATPKVLHHVAGKPLLAHVLDAARAAGSTATGVVIGPDREDVKALVKAQNPKAAVFIQNKRLGTAHAVLQAEKSLKKAKGDLIVLYGDTPLLRAETFSLIREKLAAGADVVIGAFETSAPTGYGRIARKGGRIISIVEEKEASVAEKKITLVNGGIMGFRAAIALPLIKAIGRSKTAREYYLTEAVKLAHDRGLRVDVAFIPIEDTLGINTRRQLAEAEQAMQQRLRRKAMDEGVTLAAPETVFLSSDTQFGGDVVIAPYVVIGPGVKIGDGAKILSFSHIEGARIGKGARIGPFSRLRPGTKIGAGTHVGNFVEVNRSQLGAGVDANHLSYLGDAEIGEGTNIGAGTITCNFDGANKYKTKIGRDVFIGSNSTLVAPLSIGNEVLIAAGSAITRNVTNGSLVFGRSDKQVSKAGRGATKIRADKKARAERKAKRS